VLSQLVLSVLSAHRVAVLIQLACRFRSLTRRHMGLDVAASILVVLVLRCNRSVKPIV
jgi:hypothetical protein